MPMIPPATLSFFPAHWQWPPSWRRKPQQQQSAALPSHVTLRLEEYARQQQRDPKHIHPWLQGRVEGFLIGALESIRQPLNPAQQRQLIAATYEAARKQNLMKRLAVLTAQSLPPSPERTALFKTFQNHPTTDPTTASLIASALKR